ncbi:GNAT family N-acetyltransferase [Streptomyces sp. NPDC003077]|uniref:GNAT family N-acetyltransferase n=1 Tax=Streptomyces sp. NPDC003077 TaxID=3154443 RepID=UPI0033B37CF6
MSGLRIREMTEADVEDVSALRIRGWQVAYPGLVPQPYLDGLDIAEDVEQRRKFLADAPPDVVNLIAERAGEVVGWLAFGPARDRDVPAGEGEVYAVYVRPGDFGTGVGRALMKACLARARDDGRRALRLWVIDGNVPAQRFYERAGFTADGAVNSFEVTGGRVHESRYALVLIP